VKILRSEKIAAYSHLGTTPFFLLATAYLLVTNSGNFALQSVILGYGLSGMFLFSSSFLYHANKQQENAQNLWRKLDHTAIFFLIAGTYTPLCYLYLEGAMKWSILGAQWSLVLAGTIFKFILINAPRFIGTLIYVVMGWIVIVPITILVDVMPTAGLFMLFSGGVLYTIGAIIYGFKWPDPNPSFFGFHEIFHVFVSGAALIHLAMIVYRVQVANIY
jgi:hemolysin III